MISLLVCLTYILLKIVIYGLSYYSGEISKATTDRVTDPDILRRSRAYNSVDDNKDQIESITIYFIVLLVIYSIYVFYSFYVQFLSALIDAKQYSWFKVFTCCRCDYRNFAQDYMNRNAQKVEGKQEGINNGPEANILPINIELKDLDRSSITSKNDVSDMIVAKQVDDLADSINPLEELVAPALADARAKH